MCLLLCLLLLLCIVLLLSQGGSVTCLSLTDTQLLMGSSAGVVQHFDLFSGQQQLITRHSSGVAALRTHKQQQQQLQQLPGLDSEDWLILVGCMDGQVRMGCSRLPSLTLLLYRKRKREQQNARTSRLSKLGYRLIASIHFIAALQAASSELCILCAANGVGPHIECL